MLISLSASDGEGSTVRCLLSILLLIFPARRRDKSDGQNLARSCERLESVRPVGHRQSPLSRIHAIGARNLFRRDVRTPRGLRVWCCAIPSRTQSLKSDGLKSLAPQGKSAARMDIPRACGINSALQPNRSGLSRVLNADACVSGKFARGSGADRDGFKKSPSAPDPRALASLNPNSKVELTPGARVSPTRRALRPVGAFKRSHRPPLPKPLRVGTPALHQKATSELGLNSMAVGSSPSGAKESSGSGWWRLFFRPAGACLSRLAFTHGSRRGLLSAAALRLPKPRPCGCDPARW